jgi:hypothetical protein
MLNMKMSSRRTVAANKVQKAAMLRLRESSHRAVGTLLSIMEDDRASNADRLYAAYLVLQSAQPREAKK